jgi:hypothetical protein
MASEGGDQAPGRAALVMRVMPSDARRCRRRPATVALLDEFFTYRAIDGGELNLDPVAQQRAPPAARAAEDGECDAALDLKTDAIEHHTRAPCDTKVFDDDVRSIDSHCQIPITANSSSVNTALITITLKIDISIAGGRASADCGGTVVGGESWPQATMPIASPTNGLRIRSNARRRSPRTPSSSRSPRRVRHPIGRPR